MKNGLRIGLPALLLLAVAAYVAYWFWLSERLEQGFRQWVAAQGANGVSVSHGPVTVGGFPYRLALQVPTPAIAAPSRPGKASWSADALTLYFQTWKPSHGIVAIEGVQVIGWRDPSAAGGRQSLSLATSRSLASFLLDGAGAVTRVDLDLRDAALSGSLGLHRATRLLARAVRGQGQAGGGDGAGGDGAGGGVLQLNLRGEGLQLDPALRLPDNAIALFDLALDLTPPPASLLARDLDAWRDSGGVAEIRSAELRSGGFAMTAEGTVALDAARRPEGAAVLSLRGADAFAKAVAGATGLGEIARLGLGLALTALQTRDADGEPQTRVPLAIQDGVLKITGIPLGQVGPLYGD